jgi:hypothetical protein
LNTGAIIMPFAGFQEELHTPRRISRGGDIKKGRAAITGGAAP